ncbi:MAG: DNA polymerase III subunit delta [Candidatus Margulisiibacteriota bacterium]
MDKQVYLLHGEEGVLISEHLQQLKAQIGADALNTDVIDGPDADINTIVQSLQSAPMFLAGGKKVVVVKDFPLLKAGRTASGSDDEGEGEEAPDPKSKKQSDDAVERLIDNLQNLADDTVVVFTFQESSNWKSSQKVDKRKKLYKALKKTGTVLEFNNFNDWEADKLAGWVRHRVGVENKQIADDAIYYLNETVGNHLGLLSSEIKKAVTFIGDRPRIEKKDVLLLASEGQTAGFSLVNALRDRDLVAAMKCLKSMLYYGENEVGLLMRIVSQFRTLLQIRYLQEQNRPLPEITKAIGGHPYAVKLLFQAAKKFRLDELTAIMQMLAEADYRLKTGQMSKDVLIEMVVIDICKGTNGSPLVESMID